MEQLQEPPRGTITRKGINAKRARMINNAIARCSEMFVLSSEKSEAVEALCLKYGKYRVEPDLKPQIDLTEKSLQIGFVLVARTATDRPPIIAQ